MGGGLVSQEWLVVIEQFKSAMKSNATLQRIYEIRRSRRQRRKSREEKREERRNQLIGWISVGVHVEWLLQQHRSIIFKNETHP